MRERPTRRDSARAASEPASGGAQRLRRAPPAPPVAQDMPPPPLPSNTGPARPVQDGDCLPVRGSPRVARAPPPGAPTSRPVPAAPGRLPVASTRGEDEARARSDSPPTARAMPNTVRLRKNRRCRPMRRPSPATGTGRSVPLRRGRSALPWMRPFDHALICARAARARSPANLRASRAPAAPQARQPT